MEVAATISPSSSSSSHERRIAELETALAVAKGELDDALGTITRLRRAYTHALEQLQLLRRRLFLAKAERADVGGAQLAFDSMFQEVQRLEKALDAAEGAPDSGAATSGDADGPPKDKKKRAPGGQGRRNLSESNLPVIRVDISSPELEETAERIGVEESSRLGYERGGMRHIILVRAVYKSTVSMAEGAGARPDGDADAVATPTEDGAPGKTRDVFITTPLPKELFRRSFLAPSMIAHLLVTKYMLGVPFYRLEQQMRLQGAPLDRGTMRPLRRGRGRHPRRPGRRHARRRLRERLLSVDRRHRGLHPARAHRRA